MQELFRDQVEETVDQELTVELARMLGGKFVGTGEARRPYLVVGSSSEKKAQNLILSRIRELQLHMGMGAIVQEAANTGRAIVSIDMNLRTGLDLAVY